MTRRESSRRPSARVSRQDSARRQRRQENLSRVGRLVLSLSRRWGLAVMLLAVMGVGAWFLCQEAETKGWFSLRTVRCRGFRLADAEQTARWLGLRRGIPLTSIDLGRVARMAVHDPRFLHVTVGRSWPHGIELTVTEDVPQVCDIYGRIYGTSGRCMGKAPENLLLPVLTGAIVPDAASLSHLLTGLDSLRRTQPALWRSLRTLHPVTDGVRATVTGIPAEILLPLEKPAPALQRAGWLYAQLGEGASRVASFDLRYAPYAVLVPTGRTGS